MASFLSCAPSFRRQASPVLCSFSGSVSTDISNSESHHHHVLLVATRADPASLNLATALMEYKTSVEAEYSWSPLEPFHSKDTKQGELSTYIGSLVVDAPDRSLGNARQATAASLWLLNDRLTQADDLDKRWADRFTTDDGSGDGNDVSSSSSSRHRRLPDEVIFLSRHASESGRPCLTVHPIGTPSALRTDLPRFGGRPGRCVPPNLRMASLLRRVKKTAAKRGLLLGRSSDESNPPSTERGSGQGGGGGGGDFEVSPEATHHGPWLETPAAFIEIGSREPDWERSDAARVWAEALHEDLFGGESGIGGGGGRGRGSAGSDPAAAARRRSDPMEVGGKTSHRDYDDHGEAVGVVVIGIGGGHYCPKISDLVGDPRVDVGHIVPSYALSFGCDNEELGDWDDAVREAVQATRAAMKKNGDQRELVALVDKKALKAAERAKVVALLGQLGVRSAMKKNAVL